jgi:hypothetical protein
MGRFFFGEVSMAKKRAKKKNASTNPSVTKLPIIKENLASVEKRLSVHDEIAMDQWQLRKQMIQNVMTTFKWVNLFVVVGVIVVFTVDQVVVFRKLGPVEFRIINSNVIIALIGGTTVQLGAIALAVSRWLFPSAAGGEKVKSK